MLLKKRNEPKQQTRKDSFYISRLTELGTAALWMLRDLSTIILLFTQIIKIDLDLDQPDTIKLFYFSASPRPTPKPDRLILL